MFHFSKCHTFRHVKTYRSGETNPKEYRYSVYALHIISPEYRVSRHQVAKKVRESSVLDRKTAKIVDISRENSSKSEEINESGGYALQHSIPAT